MALGELDGGVTENARDRLSGPARVRVSPGDESPTPLGGLKLTE